MPTSHLLFFVISALLFGGCVSTPVTPTRLSNSHNEPAFAQTELATWSQAVDLCNLFLKSDQRHTLPAGSITLDQQGMVYSYQGGAIRMTVKCTSFGDILVYCKMAAQERSWGFVVGRTKPRVNRLTDNSLFRYPNGAFTSNIEVAGTILHELTHIYTKSCLSNPWEVIKYYTEACFLFRYRTHSMEKLPYRTSAEFYTYIETTRKAHPDWFDQTPTNASKQLPQPARATVN